LISLNTNISRGLLLLKAILDHIEDIAPNIKTFWFRPQSPVRHTAGQFTEIRLPHASKDKRGDKRWFTISSSPTEDLVSITTKFSTNPSSSFKKTLQSLKPGTELNLASPMGDFILPKDPTIPLIFVAGGIGCTPFRSIIKYVLDSGEKRDITLLYAANSEQEVAFMDIFKSLNKKFKILVGERLTAEKIKDLANVTSSHYIYLSGPEPMVEALEKDLKRSGVDKRHIHTDFFPGYTSV
jgi:glycine betaine catabolism B